MSELNTLHDIKLGIPEKVTKDWLDDFNNTYAIEKHEACVTTEDWLEQPVNAIGSGYFILSDAMGADGWWQTIRGTVHGAANTNVPHYTDTGFADVLALTDARIIKPDGSERVLAEGRLVLIRLDRIKESQISLRLTQEVPFYLPGGDGNWSNPELPQTIEAAHERIKVLQNALGFYSDGRAYDTGRENDSTPSYSELMDDKGTVARIGRLAANPEEFAKWVAWARVQDRRW